MRLAKPVPAEFGVQPALELELEPKPALGQERKAPLKVPQGRCFPQEQAGGRPGAARVVLNCLPEALRQPLTPSPVW